MKTEKHTCCGISHGYHGGNFPCPWNAKFNRDGKWYCGTHDPVAIAERQRKLDEKNRPKRERQEFEYRKQLYAGEMLDMLEIFAGGWWMDVPREKVQELVKKVRGNYGKSD